MSNATPSRLGFTDGTSSGSFAEDNELFLKVFGGEVMTAFQETNVMAPLHMVRSIKSGKSAQFPAIGKTTAAYHTPGAEILGNTIKHNERVINIDNLLIAHTFIANIDEAKNHYDVRAPYSTQLGRALALEYDQNILQLEVLAARASATVSGENGGSTVNNADFDTNGATLAAGIFSAAQELDEKDVPENDRYCVVRPAQYYLLVQETNVINRDWGGAGVYAEGKVMKVAGIHIVKSNNLPSTSINAASGEQNTYNGDFSVTQAVVFNKMAVGTVKLLDLAVESEYDIRRQGTLMVAKYAMGHGILRPDCAVELRTDNPA
jgi:hypothetical protein